MTRSINRSELSRRTILGAAIAAPTAVAAITVVKGGYANEAVNVMTFIPEEFHARILSRTADPSQQRARALAGYIQTAIDAAAARRCRLIIPAGLYTIAPTGSFAAEAGPCQRCFAIRSHMAIDAEAGASFRIADDVSTDRTVVFMCMFGTDEQLVDLSWRGLDMDMNGQNNPISPDRGSGRYSLLNQAQIFISGTPRGRAALASNVTIERCRFANTPGVSCIVSAQSNAAGMQLGRNWRISNCHFIDGGLDTPDHSAIYAWAQDVVCEGCEFTNARPKSAVGGNVAYEVHGSRQHFSNNRIHNYYQGVWIDGNKTETIATDIRIEGNTFDKVSASGIMFYGVECHVDDVIISRNIIDFDDMIYPGVDLKIGVGCLAARGQRQITIEGNSIAAQGTRTATAGVTIQAPSVAGESHDAVTIDGNTCTGTTFGVQVVTNAVCGLGTVAILSNRFRNLSPAGAYAVPQGIGLDFHGAASPVRRLVLLDNSCIDDRGRAARCAFGIRLQGRIIHLQVARNIASGMTVAPYAEAKLAVAVRDSAGT